MFKDKTILITGGTGSFGRAMVSHLRKTGFKRIRIFSRDEMKQEMMRSELGELGVEFYIGDVRDRQSVDAAMVGVDLVFHAAALKQVPSCEFFPIEAMRTNVLGSSNVLDSAIVHGVGSVVCLSTDKAVYPVNAMGLTKALMEKVAQAAARRLSGQLPTIAVVRYGNVMYSRGSVIPLLVHQIQQGSPLTITEPQMTRFMLPLTRAVELVEFAFRRANPGDIFIRKSPAATVGDLVVALKNIFRADNAVKMIGIRHGEKIHETLVNADEFRRCDDLGDYYRIRLDGRGLQYTEHLPEGDAEESSRQEYTSDNTRLLSVSQLETLLLELPEIQAELAK